MVTETDLELGDGRTLHVYDTGGAGTEGRLVRRGELEGVSLGGSRLRISRPKKDEPDGMDAVTRLVYSLVPRVKLTDLLVEVDSWCGYSGRFTHLKTGEPAKDKKVLHAAIMADGVNLGLAKMAEARTTRGSPTKGSPGPPTGTRATRPTKAP